ncbi:hypothetical protein IFM89_005922 [Coptis chinensis]|uniref:Uncharacterized protein n=1 Tax=Coptis chinensis TaxID=261450 RepID=A0A835M745_9MAGN|nr:hypothetical protein IFM89_005922 [Coptis chinensis]
MCLVKDPSKRPTATELLKHPFFKNRKPNIRSVLEKLSPTLTKRLITIKTVAVTQDKMEETSQNEYKRGISCWDFNLEEIKAQAALLEDDVVEEERTDVLRRKNEGQVFQQVGQFNSMSEQRMCMGEGADGRIHASSAGVPEIQCILSKRATNRRSVLNNQWSNTWSNIRECTGELSAIENFLLGGSQNRRPPPSCLGCKQQPSIYKEVPQKELSALDPLSGVMLHVPQEEEEGVPTISLENLEPMSVDTLMVSVKPIKASNSGKEDVSKNLHRTKLSDHVSDTDEPASKELRQ